MADERLAFGTPAWFEMLGEEMRAGARRTPQAAGYRFSLVERYGGAAPMADGSILGFRVDVAGADATFRAGVSATEIADLIVDADVALITRLAKLKTDDPAFQASIAKAIADGAMKVTGDGPMGSWSDGVHDAVADRTA